MCKVLKQTPAWLCYRTKLQVERPKVPCARHILKFCIYTTLPHIADMKDLANIVAQLTSVEAEHHTRDVAGGRASNAETSLCGLHACNSHIRDEAADCNSLARVAHVTPSTMNTVNCQTGSMTTAKHRHA